MKTVHRPSEDRVTCSELLRACPLLQYVCMYVCMYVCVYARTRLYIPMYVRMCVYMHV